MPAFAPGEARGLSARSTRLRRAALVRAVYRLGFFVSAAALGACAASDPRALARAADVRYGTSAFTWLIEHDPSAVVAWRVPAGEVAALLPGARVAQARTDAPCAQAAAAHAALFLLAPRSARPLRDRAEDCGFALFRDDGALVIAPLGR